MDASNRNLNAGDQIPRVLFYSHDTFGLGHLRRSRALAGAITNAYPSVSAIILTGSPVAGRFAFPDRVDHIRLPGVTKNEAGHYVSQTLGLDIEETTELRAGIIKSVAENFKPDLVIVDKEPTGFKGELLPALDWLKKHTDAHLVLGLRDVLDDPAVIGQEWERKGAIEAAEQYYDDVWIYGTEEVFDPTQGLDFSAELKSKLHWTGYLRRENMAQSDVSDEPFILVTPGGGGDGKMMVDLVLSAYEQDPDLEPKAVLVFGPFLSGQAREDFEERVQKLQGRVTAIGFESQIENYFIAAEGVVSMGGYNTFCEILSFQKPAVIVPRSFPRKEQFIRAGRAEELGLVRMLHETRDGFSAPAMIRAIRDLAKQPAPRLDEHPGLLDGLDYVVKRTGELLPLPLVKHK